MCLRGPRALKHPSELLPQPRGSVSMHSARATGTENQPLGLTELHTKVGQKLLSQGHQENSLHFPSSACCRAFPGRALGRAAARQGADFSPAATAPARQEGEPR